MIRFSLILAIGFKLAAAPAVGQPSSSLDTLLDRAGKRVEEFWDQFSVVSCTETVQQVKLGASGKVLAQRSASYDYLVILQLAGEDLTVEESRLAQGQPKKESNKPLLTTSGFSTLLLIFHPIFQNSYEYSLTGVEEAGGRKLQKVHFEHVQGRRSPSALQLRGRDYPLEWQGSAWIDPRTGYIDRISAELKTSMDDVGLKKLSSEVQYTPVQFSTEKQMAWLPEVAVIEANTEHQHWRNTHMFSRYRKFSVTTDAKTEVPKQ
jgi:hypothetical protein